METVSGRAGKELAADALSGLDTCGLAKSGLAVRVPAMSAVHRRVRKQSIF